MAENGRETGMAAAAAVVLRRLGPFCGQGLGGEPTLRAYILFAMAGIVIGWCLGAEATIKAGGHPMGFWPEAWRYADSNVPMILSADGFAFIGAAKQALAGGYAGIHPFAQLTAFLASLLGTPVENMAFQLSFLVHLGLGLIVAFWGRLAKLGCVAAFLAACLVPLVPVWLERGGPGQYDTDLAVNLFLQLGLFLMVKATLGLKEKNWPALYVAAAVASFGVLGPLWGADNALGLMAPALGLWFMFFMPLRLMSVKARLTVVAVAALWDVLILLFPDMSIAPRAMTSFLHGKVASYLGLPTFITVGEYVAYGFHTDMLSRSIQELASIPVPMLLERLGGTVLGGAIMLAATILAIVKSPLLRFPLVYSLMWIVLGSRSIRLIYLGTFPLCLAMGALPCLAAVSLSGLPRIKPSPGAPRWVGASLDRIRPLSPVIFKSCGFMVAVLVVLDCFQWRVGHGVDVRWQRQHDVLVEALRKDLGDGHAYMWNWWDDGHFLSSRLGAQGTVHFNGGGTNPLKGYLPGHSFVMENRDVAAKWIRFFAIRGQNEAIQPAIDVWGSDAAWDNLERVLAGEEVPGVEKIPNWREWFLPKGKVYWYLPGYFFSISNWWVPLGLTRDPNQNEIRPHIERIMRSQFAYNAEAKSLTVDMPLYNRGYKDFGQVINTMETPLAAPWPTAKAPYIVYSGQNDYAYITDQIGVRTLPLYMMTPGGPPLEKFRPVAVDPAWGGIWEVVP